MSFMANKMNKSYKAEISGVLNIEDGIIFIMVEDVNDPVILSEFIKEFDDSEVKISVCHKKDMR